MQLLTILFCNVQVQAKQFSVSGRIFGIESVRSRQPGKGNILRLKVNFLPEIITLAKEVRLFCLLFLAFHATDSSVLLLKIAAAFCLFCFHVCHAIFSKGNYLSCQPWSKNIA